MRFTVRSCDTCGRKLPDFTSYHEPDYGLEFEIPAALHPTGEEERVDFCSLDCLALHIGGLMRMEASP